MIQISFLNNDAVFHDDHASIHTSGTDQSWFEEHEDELKHLLLPAQSPDLNMIEPLWSILAARMRDMFPSATSLKQLEDVFRKELYKIPLEAVQNL
jgi:hypothetical protein